MLMGARLLIAVTGLIVRVLVECPWVAITLMSALATGEVSAILWLGYLANYWVLEAIR